MTMPRSVLAVLLGALCAPAVFCQSNITPGLNGRLSLVDALTYWGRRGPAHPNGEIGMAMLNEMCNPGSVEIPWYAAMAPDHPKFGFLIVRESGGRMVQISDWSFCKHAFTSTNYSGPCGTCNGSSAGGSRMGLNCADTYGAGNNGDPYWLGPPDEIDPWLGTWNPVGSYFDRGDPAATGAAASDGNRSLSRGQTNAFDNVKNRVTVKEQELLVPGRFFYGIHLIHQGEASANRGDNLASRGFTPSYGGGQWTLNNNQIGQSHGTILQQWQNATIGQGGNGSATGTDDGSFFVAVVTTQPGGGSLWHYEYAVHNFDNSRGGQSLRIPLCGSSVVSNAGFRDIDGNTLNDWTWSRIGNELVFQGPATNPQNWNQIFNFWFDCTTAPAPGHVTIDQARLGQGAPSVTVPARVPGGVARVEILGPGCGQIPPLLSTLGGDTVIPNPTFKLMVAGTPLSGTFVFASPGTASIPLGSGCTQYLDNQGLVTHGFYMTGVTGLALVPLPIPNNPALEGLALHWQAAQLVNGGPIGGVLHVGNGLKLRVGNALTCP